MQIVKRISNVKPSVCYKAPTVHFLGLLVNSKSFTYPWNSCFLFVFVLSCFFKKSSSGGRNAPPLQGGQTVVRIRRAGFPVNFTSKKHTWKIQTQVKFLKEKENSKPMKRKTRRVWDIHIPAHFSGKWTLATSFLLPATVLLILSKILWWLNLNLLRLQSFHVNCTHTDVPSFPQKCACTYICTHTGTHL